MAMLVITERAEEPDAPNLSVYVPAVNPVNSFVSEVALLDMLHAVPVKSDFVVLPWTNFPLIAIELLEVMCPNTSLQAVPVIVKVICTSREPSDQFPVHVSFPDDIDAA